MRLPCSLFSAGLRLSQEEPSQLLFKSEWQLGIAEALVKRGLAKINEQRIS